MMQPTYIPSPSAPSEHASFWRHGTLASMAVTGLGALIGSTLATILGSRGLGWTWADVLVAPLTALVAAAFIYGFFRGMPLLGLPAAVARVLVSAGAIMILTAALSGRLALAGLALWFMVGATVVVTALTASGARR